MIAQEWDRTIWVDIKSNEILTPATFETKESPEIMKEAEKRYPVLQDKVTFSNLREEADHLFKCAKNILATDGYHVPVALIGYPNGEKRIQGLHMADRTEKHLVFRNLAAEIEKTGANSIIIISEVWIAPVEGTTITPQEIESPERREALQLIALNDCGERSKHQIFFEKDSEGKVRFGEEMKFEADSINILTPFIEVWSKQSKGKKK
jgi:hypothetical protein